MKTYKNELPNFIKPQDEFYEFIKCEKCHKKYIASKYSNTYRKDVKIFISTVIKNFLLSIFSSTYYTRKKYLKIFIYKTVCPKCGKVETLYYSNYPKKQYIYSDWKKHTK